MEKLLRELLEYVEKSRTPVNQVSALLGMLNLTALVSILAAREGVPMPAVGAALAGQARNEPPVFAADSDLARAIAGMNSGGVNQAVDMGSEGVTGGRETDAPGPAPLPPLPELATMLQLLLGNLGGPPGGSPPGPGSKVAEESVPEKAAEPENEPGEA